MDAHGEPGAVQRLARIGSWYWTTLSGEHIASEGLCRIFGRDSIPPFAEQSGVLYPAESWTRVDAARREVFATGIGYSMDLPALHGDGTALWVNSRCEAVRNEAGEIIGLRGTIQDISERQLIEQNARFHASLLNAVGQAVIATDAAGKITYMNLAAENLYGWPGQAAIGRGIIEITVPESAVGQADEIMRELSAGRPWSGEFQVRHRNGTQFPVDAHDTPILDSAGKLVGIIGVSSDISQRRAAEVALELERGKLAAAFDNSAVGFIVSDSRGGDISMNGAARRMVGSTEGAVQAPFQISTSDWELSNPDGSIIPSPDWPTLRALRGEFVRDAELHWRHRASGRTWISNLTIVPVRSSTGQVMHIVLTLIDVTETRRLDRALQLNMQELEKARAAAEKSNLAKSDFLSSMSHELRSPLHTILGFAQLMDDDYPPPTLAQAASVEQILKAGWYLLELINEILDLAQIESGKLVIAKEPTSLTEVLRECRAMILPQKRKRGVSVTFPEIGDAFFVDADRTRLKQVLINLISNAIKYNRENGSVVVSCQASPEKVTPSRVRVTISDTGAGLSPEMLLQLFQPFNRLGQEFKEMEGTGIGLVMSKRLVELMGGVIGVESTVGSGSVFWFELNAAPPPRAPYGTDETLAPEPWDPDLNTPRSTLLCVEDNQSNRELIEKIIRNRRPNIRMLSAADAHQGLRLARAEKPDVILMDINLPGINGFEALKQLRADPATAHIPVVALSANAMPRDVKNGIDAGFFSYLTKPIKIAALVETLDQALEYGLVT